MWIEQANECDNIRIIYIILLLLAFGFIDSLAASVNNATCPGSTILCNGNCTDTNVDELNCGACGNVCPLGKACINGSCSCFADLTLCNGTCADTGFDLQNCGKCGNVCPVGMECIKGKCSCPAGLTSCNGFCTDISSDERNCGSCGNVCPSGRVCFEGRCLTQVEVCTNGYCRFIYR